MLVAWLHGLAKLFRDVTLLMFGGLYLLEIFLT